MPRFGSFSHLVAALVLIFVPRLAEAGHAQAAQDAISIISVKPDGPVPAGVPVTFTFELEVTLRSAEEADVSIGFNAGDALESRMGPRQPVKAGTQRLVVSADTVPADNGRLSAFGALIIIAPKRTGSGSFRPLARAFHAVAVVADTSAARPISESEFKAADTERKRAVLGQIANGRSIMAIEEVVAIVRTAIRDADPDVRLAAMEAVSGRQLASSLARYVPPKGAQPDLFSARREVPPADWGTDTDRLGYFLHDTLLELVRSDPDEGVRSEALRAMASFGRPDPTTPFSEAYIDLCVRVFRTDRSGQVRAQVVLLLDYGTNDTPAIRDVLKDAFADPDVAVRLAALRTLASRGRERPRFSYADVGEMLLKLLDHSDIEFRLSAMHALERLGAGAREALPRLDRIAADDANDRARRMAVRAAGVIRAAK